jgi:hypothetical protein
MLARRDNYKSSKLRARRRKLLFIRTGIAIFAAVLIIGGFSLVSKLKMLSVSAVTFSGNQVVTNTELQEVVDMSLRGNYLGLFSKRNILLFPKKHILASVADAFPRIQTADLELEDTNSIRITVEERKPHALWCDHVALLDEDQIRKGCYFMDDHGLIFAPAPYFSGSVFFRYFGAVKGEPVGLRYLSEDMFKALELLRQDLAEIDIPVAGIEVKDNNEIEILFTQSVKQGAARTGKILATMNDLGRTFENVETFVRESRVSDRKFLDNVEYIDVRFGNKVFYKKY